mgnify:CR=1 FL=1
MLVHDLLKRGNDSDDAVYSQLGALTYLGLKVAVENSRRRLYGGAPQSARRRLFPQPGGIYCRFYGDCFAGSDSRSPSFSAQRAGGRGDSEGRRLSLFAYGSGAGF